ncbi:MAG: ribosomal protection-like ABC-F family protein [Clostridiaceae bacterium]
MLILECNKLKKYHGDVTILDIEKLNIYSEDKVGVVGLNGAGKTTLLNIISGKIKSDEGTVKIFGRCSYITQLDEAEEKKIESSITKKFNVGNGAKDYFSGGEKTRFKIAMGLSEGSNLLLADEPTSNLDIDGINILQKELGKYKGALLLISHDRGFLDKLCNKIIEIEEGHIKIYNGNYTDYKIQKDKEKERENFEYHQYTKEKRRLEGAMREKSEKSKTIKNAPSRMGNSEARLHKMGNQRAKYNLDKAVKNIEARINHLEVKEKPKEIKRTVIDVNESGELYSKILISGKKINKEFKNKIIFNNAEFNIYNGTKTALIGENGSGKSTLIKMIMESSNNIKLSQKIKLGYFSQNLDILDSNLTIIENVMKESIYDETFVRTTLARLLFKREDIYKKVKVLSGGEKVKVSFAKILLSDINMLILDEPTNYLDIYSTEAMEEALLDYNGTLLFVSHDSRFVKNIADNIISIENNKLNQFRGSYEEYMIKKSENNNSGIEELKMKQMLLENRLSEIIGKLSIPSKGDNIEELDKEYLKLIAELKLLKNK